MRVSEVYQANTDIEDAEFDRVHEMIGEVLRIRQFNHEATLDTIRHYSHRLGDDNPLFCDDEYASKRLYGQIVAPPTFPHSLFSPSVTPGFGGLSGVDQFSR